MWDLSGTVWVSENGGHSCTRPADESYGVREKKGEMEKGACHVTSVLLVQLLITVTALKGFTGHDTPEPELQLILAPRKYSHVDLTRKKGRVGDPFFQGLFGVRWVPWHGRYGP